jgi:hypothetical protein
MTVPFGVSNGRLAIADGDLGKRVSRYCAVVG